MSPNEIAPGNPWIVRFWKGHVLFDQQSFLVEDEARRAAVLWMAESEDHYPEIIDPDWAPRD